LIERGDIPRALASDPPTFAESDIGNVGSDDLAEEVWGLYRDRTRAEVVVNALG
jgi:hypothetical protein